MKITDMGAYNRTQLTKMEIKRFKFLFVPLVLSAFCIISTIFHISLSGEFRLIISFVYCSYLLGLNNAFKERGVSLIEEFVKQARADINYTKSQELPENPYLRNGYLYAKSHNEEFPEPYELKYSIYSNKIFTIDGYVSEYISIISIDGKEYKYTGFGEDLDKFKVNALRDFENKGYEIVAITNEYGQYLWDKGDDFKHGKLYKRLKMWQLYLLKSVIFICLLTPVVYLVKPMFSW